MQEHKIVTWLADGTEVGIIATNPVRAYQVAKYLDSRFGVMPQDQDPPHSKAISFVDSEK